MTIGEIRDEALRIVGDRGAARDGYSGRPMFGHIAAFAVETHEELPLKLHGALLALGLTYDAMGLGSIYYTRDVWAA